MTSQPLKKIITSVIAPSILAADFACLLDQCNNVIQLGADSLHLDVMDGHFVPNLTFGPPIIQSIRNHLPLVHLDCHLMVTNPQHYIKDLKKAKVNCITFHVQANYQSLETLCDTIKKQEIQVGVSIKPKTQISQQIQQLILKKKIDKILVMTVQPGFGGQKFMPDMMKKVKYLRQKYDWLDIQVDGGIYLQNVEISAQNGANCIVSGTGIFAVKDRRSIIGGMKEIVNLSLGIQIEKNKKQPLLTKNKNEINNENE